MSTIVPAERRPAGRACAGRRGLSARALLLAAAAAGACDGGARPPDAQARPNAASAEVSVRFDVTPGKTPTVHVLAFRASVVTAPGGAAPDVLGTVDSLAAAGPDQGCALRDVDATTSALGARGAAIELEEMTGIGVGLGSGEALLRPFPRLFPDVATVVGGVVAEVGPQELAALPEHVSLYSADIELPVADLAVPAAPRIAAVNGTAPAMAPAAPLRVDAQEALAVTVAGAAGGLLALRPFGATVAVACAIPPATAPELVITIPRPLLARLLVTASSTGNRNVAASLEVARRSRIRQSLGAPATRISVEVRTSTVVELRP